MAKDLEIGKYLTLEMGHMTSKNMAMTPWTPSVPTFFSTKSSDIWLQLDLSIRSVGF